MKIIHITRKDLIAQAISYQIALQTNQWTSNQSAPDEDLAIEFNAGQLTSIIDSFQADNNSITMFASAFGYPYLHVSYEDLVEDPQTVLDKIATFAGEVGRSWPIQPPSIQKQSSDLNDAFRARYCRYLRRDTL